MIFNYCLICEVEGTETATLIISNPAPMPQINTLSWLVKGIYVIH